MNRKEILIVDDEVGIRELLSEILEDEGYGVAVAENAQQARTYRLETQPALVLLDIWMPDTDGVTLLREWAASGQLTMPVVMLSGHGTIETAVEATRIGAFDFLEKPVGLQKLLSTVARALKVSDHAAPVTLDLDRLGKGTAVQELKRCIQQLVRTQRPMLLVGEAGSGFEICAGALHKPGTPWIVLDDCQRMVANPLALLEEAREGVIFCPEIADLSRTEQKGLQFLLSKTVRYEVTLITASSAALGGLAAEGKFDPALLSALSAGVATVPPLRSRREDIPALVELLWHEITQPPAGDALPFDASALTTLRNAAWPGNIAQLESVVSNLLLTHEGTITGQQVQALLGDSGSTLPQQALTARFFDLPLREAREAFERLYFEQLLGKEQNNMSRVADKAGLERTHLYRKLKQLNIRFSRRNEEVS
jgi:DNA-binding NtrC family response regulator